MSIVFYPVSQHKIPFLIGLPRHDYRGISSDIDGPLYKEMYDFWLERAASVHESTGANQTFVIQHVSANVAQIGSDNGGNPLNLPQKDHQCKLCASCSMSCSS